MSPLVTFPVRSRRAAALLIGALACSVAASGCSGTNRGETSPAGLSSPTILSSPTTTTTTTTTPEPARAANSTSTTQDAAVGGLPSRPEWLGRRDLVPPGADPDVTITGLDTPPELLDRRFATIDRLAPPPPGAPFIATIEPLAGDLLEASTWEVGCPVPPEDLRHLTMSHWGFDQHPHTGDMVVHRAVADDVIEVFRRLFDARFPIEEMRMITDDDMTALRTGDGNVTTAFVCRAVRGGRRFSEHAHGLAIDVNPFLNPYRRGDVILPELAAHFLDRDLDAPGMIHEGDVVVTAFADIGWGWGGEWSSLLDYQHFALHDR